MDADSSDAALGLVEHMKRLADAFLALTDDADWHSFVNAVVFTQWATRKEYEEAMAEEEEQEAATIGAEEKRPKKHRRRQPPPPHQIVDEWNEAATQFKTILESAQEQKFPGHRLAGKQFDIKLVGVTGLTHGFEQIRRDFDRRTAEDGKELAGRFYVLVLCRRGNEGLDLDHCNAIYPLARGKSTRNEIQKLCRGMTNPDRKAASVTEFRRYAIILPFSIPAELPGGDRWGRSNFLRNKFEDWPALYRVWLLMLYLEWCCDHDRTPDDDALLELCGSADIAEGEYDDGAGTIGFDFCICCDCLGKVGIVVVASYLCVPCPCLCPQFDRARELVHFVGL